MNNEQLVKRIEVLEGFIKSLQASHSIPLAVHQAFLARFQATSGDLIVSSKDANSEDLTVDEAGNGTHTVLADPTGFLQIFINGSFYYIPYYPA